MRGYCDLIERFRRLPTPLLILIVLSRFVFGFGLGAALAAKRRETWRLIGWITMALGAGLALPAAAKIFREE